MRGTGFVLMALSPQRMHLGEYLADAGLDVVEGQWGLPTQIPTVIVTEDAKIFIEQVALADAVRHGLVGTVIIGTDPNNQRFPLATLNDPQRACERDTQERPVAVTDLLTRSKKIDAENLVPDVWLPSDVCGRELATVVRLAAKIATLRRQQSQHFDECQHWIELALHDGLTGLPNRRHWDAALEQTLLAGEPLSVAMIDVDSFKQINDADGHSIGDLVLREAAQAMRSQLRRSDLVARLGGDEFGLLLPRISSWEAAGILERLRHHVSKHLASVHLPVATLSAGLIHLDSDEARDKDLVMTAVSRSLRNAKQRQKNRAVSTHSSS